MGEQRSASMPPSWSDRLRHQQGRAAHGADVLVAQGAGHVARVGDLGRSLFQGCQAAAQPEHPAGVLDLAVSGW